MDPRAAILDVAAQPDGDVGAGALWIAAEDCEGVDVETLLRRFDDLAGEVRDRLGAAGDAPPGMLSARRLTSRLLFVIGVRWSEREHARIPRGCWSSWA